MSSIEVAVFVGTRADLGPLESVLDALSKDPGIQLSILTGVAFGAVELSSYLGGNQEVESNVYQLAPPMARVEDETIQVQGVSVSDGAHSLFSKRHFDALVVLGDRWELLFLLPQAYLHGIRIVHLHGGEVTEGALDERVRHAVSKLADLHCAASEEAVARLRQLGEPPERIFRTGAPGLDRIESATRLSDSELQSLFGSELKRPLALFTYHPPTLGDSDLLRERTSEALQAVLDSMGSVIVTAPGFDAGREEVLKAIHALSSREPRLIFVDNLGRAFPRVLKSVDLVVGNSSSGIIEAPTAGVASVDIGIRQQGRLRSVSVVHSGDGYDQVRNAIYKALAFSDEQLAHFTNPYREGSAAKEVVVAIREVVEFSRIKRFHDVAYLGAKYD